LFVLAALLALTSARQLLAATLPALIAGSAGFLTENALAFSWKKEWNQKMMPVSHAASLLAA
jgi:hypothetical protein